MTDRFFPNSVPTGHELALIRQIRYIPRRPDGDFFSVKVLNTATKTLVEASIKVPVWYHAHVCRFLWRHWVFIEVERRSELMLGDGLRAMLQRYIVYMDAMIEGLLMTARVKAGNDPTFRSRIFDLYLVLDHFIGRHEYNIGDAWRLANPNIILECVRVQDIRWDVHFQVQDANDSLWSGSDLCFDITKVTDDLWQSLADCVALYFNSENPTKKRMPQTSNQASGSDEPSQEGSTQPGWSAGADASGTPDPTPQMSSLYKERSTDPNDDTPAPADICQHQGVPLDSVLCVEDLV